MTTDNWPTHFRYISRRLVTQITQQSYAARPRRHAFSFSVDLPFVKIGVQAQPSKDDNLFALVREATADVADWTGTLADPSYYVRDRLELELCWFPVLMGWVDAHQVQVAAAFADTTLDDAGRTFVALFGSIHNYVGAKPGIGDDCGVYPSDVAGLYQILSLTGESADPAVDPDRLWDDARMEMLDRCNVARRLREGTTGHFPSEHLSVLAHSFFHDEDIELGGEKYDRVLLGTPIWIATLEPEPM